MRIAIRLLTVGMLLNTGPSAKCQEVPPESVSALIDQLKTGGERSRELAARLLGSLARDVDRSLNECLSIQFDRDLNRIDADLRRIDAELRDVLAQRTDTDDPAAQADLDSRKRDLDDSKLELEDERRQTLRSIADARAELSSAVARLLGDDPQDTMQAEEALRAQSASEPHIARVRLFKSAVDALSESLTGPTRDSSPNVRAQSAFSLGLLVSNDVFFGEDKARHDLIQAAAATLVDTLRDRNQNVRLRAAWACGQLPAATTVPIAGGQRTLLISVLLDVCDDSDAQVRMHAAAAVERLMN